MRLGEALGGGSKGRLDALTPGRSNLVHRAKSGI
jgi:hypothetical protein